VVWALILGCWGGVLAAAVCLHGECHTAAARAPAGDAAHGEHSAGQGRTAADSENLSCHEKAGGGHAVETPASEHRQVDRAGLESFASNSPGSSCDHCVGGAEVPSPRPAEWQSSTARRGEKIVALCLAAPVAAPAAVFTRQVAVAQPSPAGRTLRHLLIGVFRI
jgi:hypothetical protein